MFEKGTSGNPLGKPKGDRARLAEQIHQQRMNFVLKELDVWHTRRVTLLTEFLAGSATLPDDTSHLKPSQFEQLLDQMAEDMEGVTAVVANSLCRSVSNIKVKDGRTIYPWLNDEIEGVRGRRNKYQQRKAAANKAAATDPSILQAEYNALRKRAYLDEDEEVSLAKTFNEDFKRYEAARNKIAAAEEKNKAAKIQTTTERRNANIAKRRSAMCPEELAERDAQTLKNRQRGAANARAAKANAGS